MRKYIYFLLFAVILAAAGCQKAAETTPTASPNAKRYPFKGKVVSVNREKRTAEIDHEEIPGYMEAMTMSFPIHQDWVWDELKPGAEVTAELVVDNSAKDPYWLENIGIIAAPDPNAPAPPVNENFVQIGQVPPDFKLIDQDGKPLSLSDYRGKALAITFIYSECPLPDYCIKMSRNFSDLANQVAADPQLSSKIRLLSISFDPERDTPEKLRSYRVG